MFLYLKNLGIETVEPKAFYSLIYLEELSLQGNYLKQIQDGVFRPLEQVKLIYLSQNNFETMKDVSLEGVKDLKKIDLSFNYLLEIEINENWDCLKILDISNNNIRNVTTSMLPKELKILDLNSNNISEFDIDNNLLRLNLANNSLKFFDLNYLNESVLHINLQQNQIENVYPTIVNQDIEYLNLASNLISTLSFLGESELPNLRKLRLERNKIKKVTQGTFRNIHSLRFLNLSFNLLDTFILGPKDNVGTLKTLDLSHNKLKELDLSATQIFNNLQKFHFKFNYITNLNARNLKESFPKLSEINLAHNNLTCNNILEIISVFKGGSIKIPEGPHKNVNSVHGMLCNFHHSTEDFNYTPFTFTNLYPEYEI